MAAGRFLLLALLVGLVTIAAGCMKEFSPVAPDAPTEGIYIFSDTLYLGGTAQLLSSVKSLGDYRGPCEIPLTGPYEPVGTWSKCVQSVRVTPGWKTTLYSAPDYRGQSLPLTESVPDLSTVAGPCDGSWSRCALSISVARQ
jgi:hypothetical protein